MADIPKFEDTEEIVQAPKFEDTTPSFDETEPVEAPVAESAAANILAEAGKTAIGSGVGLAAGEGARRLAEEKLPGLAEDLAYRGIGGRTTPQGKKFYVESLGKQISPDMVNVTPRNIGRQVLDENILGTLGLASPEDQLVKQRKISGIKAADKANIIRGVDSPTAIDLQNILDEYKHLAGVTQSPASTSPFTALNQTNPTEAAQLKTFTKEEPKFKGGKTESILENERVKSDLQARSRYDGNTTEQARESLNKAQAEARRKASEEAVERLGGKQLLEKFQAAKQRSGNASVAEDIIARNVLTDTSNMSPGTIDKISKIVGEVALEKAPAVLSKAADVVGKFAKSGAGKILPGAGLVLGGMAGAAAATDAGLEAPEVAGLSAAEAVNPLPFTDTVQGYVQAKQAYKDTGSPISAAKAGLAGYASPATEAVNTFGTSQSNEARARMEQNMNALPKTKNNDFLNFISKSPEALNDLAKQLEAAQNGSSSYAGPLAKAANADERSKAAILYGLYQQPGFRSLVEGNGTLKTDIPGVKKSNE